MKKKTSILLLAGFVLLISACGGKPSARSIAQKWCDLNSRVYNAPDGGTEYGKAKEALKKYEQEMKSKYGNDKTLMSEIEKEVEQCENASEGRK